MHDNLPEKEFYTYAPRSYSGTDLEHDPFFSGPEIHASLLFRTNNTRNKYQINTCTFYVQIGGFNDLQNKRYLFFHDRLRN